MISRSDRIDLNVIQGGLVAGSGGYEVAHESPGLELGVYTLVAPEPDQQQPHADDEVYVVLEGRGTLEIDGTSVPLGKGTRSSSPRAPTIASSATRTCSSSSPGLTKGRRADDHAPAGDARRSNRQ